MTKEKMLLRFLNTYSRELEEFLRYHPDSALASGVSRTLDELRTGGKEHAKP